MTEAMIVEAVRSAGGVSAATGAAAVAPSADPQAVEAFEKAMMPDMASPIPFAQQVGEVWQSAQNNYQTMLHRMTALTDMTKLGQVSLAQLTALQYQVASLSFQQEVATNIAKKASDAITTLVKNG